MIPTWLHYTLLILGAAGSYAAFRGIHEFVAPQAVQEGDLIRLAKREVGTSTAFSRLNPRGGIWERLDLLLLKNLRLELKLEQLHMMMGRPARPTPIDMLHLKELMACVWGVFGWVGTESWIVVVIVMVLGFLLPDIFFQRRIRERQSEILGTFPPLVDLAALTLEAGLDYLNAFDRILKSSSQRGPLEVELGIMLDEVSLGYSRRDALNRFAARTGVQEIRSFVGLIIQSDELGTSLVDLLRSYAADMRFRRLSRAEKLAAQAATKMLLPLIIFIFPTVFIMMLAPMIKSLMNGGLGF